MTTSLDLLDAVHAAIVAAGTDADDQVFRPGDWPTQPDQYPITKLRLIAEDRQSLGRSGPAEFLTTATVRVVSEVSAPVELDNAGATTAEGLLWRIKRQTEVAIVNGYPLSSMIQQITSMRSQLAFTSEGATHLAGIQTDIALEFYEGPESFAPQDADDLDRLDLATALPPAGLTVAFPPA
ncbi:hypothetical protein [Sphingomonas sp. Leaf25]|uniref:hypothetical protein n=1 Tax=Sphingomonas sp. Leaf25 TaxID=1735692 RepID=UPI0006F96029|nr:hypothetical protein [Sphingomonas sp. Leaf25]KQN00567.1 hypothetical protein ASE78_05640 [Sphingomonas sp. Leaf25]